MSNQILAMISAWFVMILSIVFIVCGFVLTCFSLDALLKRWGWKGASPCYCWLIQMEFVSLWFYVLGIKCLDWAILQDLEDGALILNEVAYLMCSLVLMSLVVSLLIFEVRACIGKLHRGNAK